MTGLLSRGIGAYAALLVIGAAWGLSAPMIKIATGAGHAPTAILFWQALLSFLGLGAVLALSGRLRGMRWDLAHLRLYAVVGLFGMALPSLASYSATAHLPSGIVSIVISLVPVFALPMALVLGTERFVPRRLLGVGLGALAMVLLAAPGASLEAPGLWVWVPVAALAPFFYAVEGAYVHGTRVRDTGPFQMLWAGYLFSLLSAFTLNRLEGAPFLPPQGIDLAAGAFVLAGLAGIGAYAGYLMLLRHAGAVFGAQVAYTVTGSGILWAMAVLGERYSATVWLALGLLFLGLFLVQPRGRASSAAPHAGVADA